MDFVMKQAPAVHNITLVFWRGIIYMGFPCAVSNVCAYGKAKRIVKLLPEHEWNEGLGLYSLLKYLRCIITLLC